MQDWLSLCVLILLALLFLTLACYSFYSGFLTNVTVQTCCSPINKLTFAYKFKEGSYKNSGELFKEARCVGPGLSCIGVFYDDPKKIPGPLCRSAVGCILSEGEHQVNEELLKRCEDSGFNVFSFPQVTHVVTTSIPHRLFFSTILRVRRVYPQLKQYIKERRLCAHPFLEIYRDGQIQFIVPLARQGDFYVPEVRQVERRLSEQEESHSDTDISGRDPYTATTASIPQPGAVKGCSSTYSMPKVSRSCQSGASSTPVTGTHLAAHEAHKSEYQQENTAEDFGADSNSEYSSGSGVLLSDSRDTSPMPSSVRDQGSGDNKERSSRGGSSKGLDWEWTGGHQDWREGRHRGDSEPKRLDAPTQELWGVVGGEE